MEVLHEQKFWLKNYPEGVPTKIEIERVSVSQTLRHSAEKFKDRAALIFMDHEISFQTLEAQVNRFAQALKDLGIQKGDRVAIMLPNLPQFVVAHYATLRIGAVCAMVNPLYTEHELGYLLDDSGAETLIILDSLYPRAQAIQGQTKLKCTVICHLNDLLSIPDHQMPPGTFQQVPTSADVLEFRTLIEKYEDKTVPEESEWEALAVLIYTGGTTGRSKGVMLSHANISSNAQQVLAYTTHLLAEGKELTLAIYPFFHVAGYSVVQNSFVRQGTTMVMVPRPEPELLVDMIEKYKPTVVQAVPTLYVGMLQLEKFHQIDVSKIKMFGTGAAPMSGTTYRGLKELSPNTHVTEGYGMTETGGLASTTPAISRFKQGSVGMPILNTEIKIVDIETGTKELPLGQEGEIIIRGPQVMMGYYNKPEQTAETLKDGWLYSGDIGYMDEEGWVFIVDRKKDMIIASGYNIYPKEVDEVLFAHPKIIEACTVGVPDEYRGETVKAFIVKKAEESLNSEEVISFCKEKLAAYKVPKLIEFVEELPKSAVGKILRRSLRDRAKKA